MTNRVHTIPGTFLTNVLVRDTVEGYSKRISRPEARHRYWHVHKEDRGFFPDSGVEFDVTFHGDVYRLKVNHKDDIMTGRLYEQYRFLDGDLITVTGNASDGYVLDAPDTKPYPAHSSGAGSGKT